MHFCCQNKETSDCSQQGYPPQPPTKQNNQIFTYLKILAIETHWQQSKTEKFSSCVASCNRPLFPDFPASVSEGFPSPPQAEQSGFGAVAVGAASLQVKQLSVIQTKFWQ